MQNNGFQEIGHQVMKNSDIRQETNETLRLPLLNALRGFPGCGRRRVGQSGACMPHELQKWSRGPVRPRKLEFAGQSTGEKRPGHSVEVPPQVTSRVLSSACLRGNYLRTGKESSRRIRGNSVKRLHKARSSASSH